MLRLSHGLSTMRGGGRGAGGAIREDAATYSRLASSFRSRRRRSAARTTRPATFIGTSLTDYLRRPINAELLKLNVAVDATRDRGQT